jgi:hypothetical protein
MEFLGELSVRFIHALASFGDILTAFGYIIIGFFSAR